ncbi:spherulation-specific family 4 protein [Streptomyces sp. SP18CS02]|uniref:spherulation-specific family 4 protein n=1 Tax=Streptomyces sp. SP18CS02 TaxID=3002531 RepID=UPI002E78F4F1|nr:spherulation-specific family 4 protein [Streptomyces sp. SP18CS02]MEE1757367.1 spherulation-specific family 4 protein [Streptomyces sp. SP18CS02]
MPYLIRPGTAPAATEAARLGFGVPGYAHPLVAPVEWAELTRPGTPLHWAVLNVADGPGYRPDPHCLEAAGRLSNAGVRVLGHLDLAHGSRPFGELVFDARRYLDWYRVDGYLLERCPSDRAGLAAVRRTTAALRALLGEAGGGHLVLGHGTHPHPGYLETADQLVTFAGPWTDYRWSQVAEWTADHPPERFAHLVHGVPRSHLREAMRIARWQGAGTIFFTDRTGQSGPFEALPGYWDEIVSQIGPGVSE